MSIDVVGISETHKIPVLCRSSHPEYCILLMNRLSKENLLEPIVPELELQVIKQFLLYRGRNGESTGSVSVRTTVALNMFRLGHFAQKGKSLEFGFTRRRS